MNNIAKEDLIRFCKDRIEAVRLRPLMYGGTWSGVEMILLDMFEMMEWAKTYPEQTTAKRWLEQEWVIRWHTACAKAYRGGNTFLAFILERDGITDSEEIRLKYDAAITYYFEAEKEI